MTGMKLYVHIPTGKYDIKNITNKDVPDASITKEVWVTSSVKVVCVGQIEVIDDAGEPGIPFKYGDKTAELYKWNWKWISKNKNEKRYNNMNESMLTNAEKQSFTDNIFGLPDKRKYPMPDVQHLQAAIAYFDKTTDPDEKQTLATNIIRRRSELNSDIKVSKENGLYKYVPQEMKETYGDEDSNDSSFNNSPMLGTDNISESAMIYELNNMITQLTEEGHYLVESYHTAKTTGNKEILVEALTVLHEAENNRKNIIGRMAISIASVFNNNRDFIEKFGHRKYNTEGLTIKVFKNYEQATKLKTTASQFKTVVQQIEKAKKNASDTREMAKKLIGKLICGTGDVDEYTKVGQPEHLKITGPLIELKDSQIDVNKLENAVFQLRSNQNHLNSESKHIMDIANQYINDPVLKSIHVYANSGISAIYIAQLSLANNLMAALKNIYKQKEIK